MTASATGMQSLKNHFLIAMPNMADPAFSRTVTLICEHDQHGAIGIIINRPSSYVAGELLQLSDNPNEPIDPEFAQAPLYLGGPVQAERGFALHSTDMTWADSLTISAELALSTSRDIIDALMAGRGPQHYLLTLGYAGWEPGQLEQELGENAWLHGPANADMLFHTPCEQRWTAAAKQLGIDIHLIDSHAGHA